MGAGDRETAIVDIGRNEAVLEALSARYPPYRARAPRGPLLRLDPDRVIWWRARSEPACCGYARCSAARRLKACAAR